MHLDTFICIEMYAFSYESALVATLPKFLFVLFQNNNLPNSEPHIQLSVKIAEVRLFYNSQFCA